MDYFALFDLPLGFQPDQQLLRQRFFQLSRKYHPDFYSNAGAEEQNHALAMSAAVNKGYQLLKDGDAVMQYVLQQKGVLEPEEKYQLPAEFLMEMMELNEAVMEGDRQSIEQRVAAIQSEIYAPVKEIIEHYPQGTDSKEALLQVKEYYFKKKYLNRILEGLG